MQAQRHAQINQKQQSNMLWWGFKKLERSEIPLSPDQTDASVEINSRDFSIPLIW